MFYWIKKIIQLFIVLTLIAYALNLKYHGVAARDYIKNKLFEWGGSIYHEGKKLSNSNVEDLVPQIVPNAKKEIEHFVDKQEKKVENIFKKDSKKNDQNDDEDDDKEDVKKTTSTNTSKTDKNSKPNHDFSSEDKKAMKDLIQKKSEN